MSYIFQQASYLIGEEKPGAVQFQVNLVLDPEHQTVSGTGRVTQAVNPPLSVSTRLHGQYKVLNLSLRAPIQMILVDAIGYPILQWPPFAGVGPAFPPNARLSMTLENWTTGTASFSYVDDNGDSHEVSDAPVKLLSSTQPNDA
ncbi:MAG: DUF1842 domain-containing protein [Chloroflexota bacterium]